MTLRKNGDQEIIDLNRFIEGFDNRFIEGFDLCFYLEIRSLEKPSEKE